MAKDKRTEDADPAPVVPAPGVTPPAGGGTPFVPIKPLDEAPEGTEDVGSGPTMDDNPYGASLGSGTIGTVEDAKAIASTGADMGKAAVRGVVKAGESTLETALSFDPLQAGTKVELPKPAAPETAAGKMTEGVSQFIVEYAGVSKVFKAVNLLQKGGALVTAGRAALAGGTAQAVGFDPHEERLSNFVEEHSSLANPITEYLAAKPEDSDAEGRLKNFLEGTMSGAAVEGLMSVVKGVKAIRSAATPEAKAEANDALASSLDPHLDGTHVPPEVTPPVPVVKTPEALSQEAADSIIEQMKSGEDFPVDRNTGLLNHEKIEAPGDARQLLELTAEKLAPQIHDKVGGVQTWKETTELADALGIDQGDLWANLGVLSKDVDKQAGLVLAGRNSMVGLAKRIAEESRAVDSGVRPDRANLDIMVKNLGQMMDTLLPIRTAQARGTRQWGISADGGMSLEQIRDLVTSGGDLEKVVKILNPPVTLKRKLLDAALEVRINGMLSGLKTHAVNMTTNLLNMVAHPTERMFGGDIGGLHEFMGIARGAIDSVSMMAKALKTGEGVLDSSVKGEGVRKAISADAFGIDSSSYMGTGLNWIGTAVRMPTRLLTGGDELFKQLSYRANLYSAATREGIDKGLTGRDLATYIEDRFANGFTEEGHGLDSAALHEAKVATFTNDLEKGSVAKWIQDGAQKIPAVRMIVPFIRTPTQIVVAVGQRTPLVNLFMKTYQADLAAGGSRAAAARGKMATGGMLWTAGITLAMQGKISGNGPGNKDEKAQLLGTGWKPYSVHIGGEWVDYSRIDPFGMALGLAADYTEAHRHLSEKQQESIGSAMMAALARNLSSKTYLRGIAEITQAFSEPDRRMKSWWNSFSSSFVPFGGGMQQGASLVGQNDPYMREVRDMFDAMKAKVPGLSETLPPKRDFFGEPIKTNLTISPVSTSKDLGDPVRTELANLHYGFSNPSEKIQDGRIDLTTYKNAKGQDAYDRLMELRSTERDGRYTLHERMAALIASDRYKNAHDGVDEYSSKKLDMVRAVNGRYIQVTMKKLRQEFPNLDRDIRTDEHNARNVKRGTPDPVQALLGQ